MKAPYILIRQARKGCDVLRVDVDGKETVSNHSGRTGRNDAKRAAQALAKETGFPLYNVKQGGKVVFCPFRDPFASASGITTPCDYDTKAGE